MNLTEMLDRSASRWPQKPAFIEAGQPFSYAELAERVNWFAAQLRLLRWPPGCRVGLCYPNSVDYVALTFALWRVEAVVVPIPVELAEEGLFDLVNTLDVE